MKRQSKAGTLFRMLKLVKPLSGFMVFAVIMGTLGFLAVQFIPVFGGYAVLDGLGYDTPFTLKTIWIILPILALLRAVLRYAEQKTNHYIAFTLLAIVRDKVFKSLRKLCPAKLEGRDKGDLISLITSDVELLEVFYAHTISPICIAIITETIMCIFIGSFNLYMGILAAVSFICIGVVVPLIISKVSGNTGEEIRKNAGELSAIVLENIRGLNETVQYDKGDDRMKLMNYKTDILTNKQGILSSLTGTNLAVSNSFILIFDILFLMLSLILCKNGQISFDEMIIPLIAFMSSFGPVTALANLGTTLQNTAASGERILNIIDETPETEDITGEDEITFENAECEHVTFGYCGETVLSDLSIGFPENSIIGITGKSGSGKSTLLKLLMRFWKTTKGDILISGKNIENINTDNLREIESYMTQNTELFKDTVANNIRIAKLNATREEIENAAKKASLHDFIMTLPKGYDTDVGELGDTLSGGEKQRIGLARAFLHNASFMLLDEPTSNLDSLNEAVILKALREETKGKTVVLVSHRESTMRIADKIYSVENGSVR